MPANFWQGPRIRLRGVEPADWAAHYAWDQDSDLARRLDHVYFPRSEEATKRWAVQAATRDPVGDVFHFEIETRAGDLVGSLGTHACDRRAGTFEYGIAIQPAHQRQGYASEAITLVLRYYFEELRYQKVTAHVYSFNVPSLRLHERLGFQLEARVRRMIYTEGQFFDECIYGLTAEEFAALPPPRHEQ